MVTENQRLKNENEELRVQIQVGCGESFGRKEDMLTAVFPLKMKERKSSRKRLAEGNSSRARKPSVSPNNIRVNQCRSSERKPAPS